MVQCPKCGHILEGKRTGTGTRSVRFAKKITGNDLIIYKLFVARKFADGMTVRQVQGHLYDNKIEKSKRSKRKTWNYHDVQATLSRLVGVGVLTMFQIRGARPLYGLNYEIDANGIIDRGGVL